MSKYAIPNINFPATLRQGAKGAGVKYLQALLIKQKQLISIDGEFGPATAAAVRAVQLASKQSVDGICGPNTWRALMPKAVSYKQMDSAWAKTSYTAKNDKSQTIGSSGCSPSCGAMIIASWKDSKVTPVDECAAALAGGFRSTAVGGGTKTDYFFDLAKRYGLKCMQSTSLTEVKAALGRGALVVANMGPGKFTKAGHFILLWAYDSYSDVVYVLDPGSNQTARTREGAAGLHKESKRYFIFDR